MIDSMNSAKLDVRMTIEGKDFAMIEDFVQTLVNLMIDAGTDWCCTIKVDIENSKGQYIEKDKQEATKDGSESTKIQHGI